MEQKRLQCGGETGKGLEDCGKASIGVWGSAESRGCDTHLLADDIHEHYSAYIPSIEH